MTGDVWDTWMEHDLLRDAAAAVDDWLLAAADEDVAVEDAPFDADEDVGVDDLPHDDDDPAGDWADCEPNEQLNDPSFFLNPHRPDYESRFN